MTKKVFDMRMRLEPFSRDELEKIHGATVRVLERTGIRIMNAQAASLLKDAGAKQESGTDIVKIPEGVLIECIKKAPKRFKSYGRDPKKTLTIGDGNINMGAMGSGVFVEDLDGSVRPSTGKDVVNFYRLMDALPHIDHASLIVCATDIPDPYEHLYDMLWGFQNTSKPIDGSNMSAQDAQDTVDMAAIVAGGYEELIEKPMLLGFNNPVSPLTLSSSNIDGLMIYAKYGQPCTIPPEIMAGATGPASIGGVLVQQNAEVLAAIAVSQCAKAGAPVLYGNVSTIMDMRNGAVALGAPEAALISVGAAQLARFYGIPCRGSGGNTDSLVPDLQAGAETSIGLLMAALAGYDFIYDAAGCIESSMTGSYAKLVLDDDVCGSVKRIISGIDVSEEALAVDVIEAIGQRGTFLGHPHTLRHFKSEHFVPAVFSRGRRTDFKTDLIINAREICKRILREHKVDPPLEGETEKRLVEFIKENQKRYGS